MPKELMFDNLAGKLLYVEFLNHNEIVIHEPRMLLQQHWTIRTSFDEERLLNAGIRLSSDHIRPLNAPNDIK